MTDDDVYRRQNLGNASGIGARCALVLVDFVNGFVDAAQFGGPHIAAAVQATQPLLAAFRTAGLPIVHTRVVFADDGADKNVFCMKVPPLLTLTEKAFASQIVEDLTPIEGELVLRKNLCFRILLNWPVAVAAPAWRGYCRDRRLHHQRLRARHSGRCHAVQLLHHRH